MNGEVWRDPAALSFPWTSFKNLWFIEQNCIADLQELILHNSLLFNVAFTYNCSI